MTDPLMPASESALAAVIAKRCAAARPVHIRGGGTRTLMDGCGLDQLSTSALRGIIAYSPGEMTLIARAGTPLSEINALLQNEGQALAFEPSELTNQRDGSKGSTIGGVVATNASGPRRLLAGACRDHVLGVRFVDGRGRILKSGGRVMKNVTGLDLSKLLCGSYGTLAVLSEVTLKTLPLGVPQASLVFEDITATQAVGIFARALSSPYEVSGAAHYGSTAWLRCEGLPLQLDYRLERLTDMFRDHAPDVLTETDSRNLWRGIRDLHHFADSGAPLWRLLTKPSKAPDITARLAAIGGTTAIDWGGGLIWYCGSAAAADLRRIAPHASMVRRAGSDGPAFPALEAPVAALSQRLRRVFDPAGILNPGLMGA